MFLTQNQLATALRNRERDQRHADRMANDPAYRAQREADEKAYDEYIAKHGHMEDR